MFNRITSELKESIFSVMPITLLVLIIGFFMNFSSNILISFSISSILLILGITLFSFGANLSMVIIGEKIGNALIKKRKLFTILLISLCIGIVVTIAEPDLMVLASQLPSIPKLLIILTVALGVGIFFVISIYRILKGISINTIIVIGYSIIFLLMFLSERNFITIAFDSGGVTTGPMSVPFMVALGYGFTKMRSDKKARNDTFGLVGLSSIGPIIIVLILGLLFKGDSVYDLGKFTSSQGILFEFFDSFAKNFSEVIASLTPIVLLYLAFEFFDNTENKIETKKIAIGLVASLLGLAFFLTGVEVGFIKMGYEIGSVFTESGMQMPLLFLSMLIGYLIVKAEPAIKILNEQISNLTQGSLSKKVIGVCVSVGVCLSVGFSLLRVFTGIPITYFLVPGYVLSIVLAFLTPSIFTSVAFDSGGAASGPLTTSFLLPIAIGTCVKSGGNILADAFGVVALVSLSPLITIQALGLIYKLRINRFNYKLVKDFDETIIEYGD